MREPRPSDDAVLATIDLVGRLNGSTKTVDRFVTAAKADPDADSWFYAGLCAWSLMDLTTHSLRKHGLLRAALEHLDAAVRLDPEHWPARFLRASYLTMLHSDEADEMVAFLLPPHLSLASAGQDAEALVQLQRRTGTRAAYGLGAYCLAALHALMRGDEPAALRTLRSGLAHTDEGTAPALAAQIIVPIVIVSRRAEVQRQPALHAQLLGRCRLLADTAEPAASVPEATR